MYLNGLRTSMHTAIQTTNQRGIALSTWAKSRPNPEINAQMMIGTVAIHARISESQPDANGSEITSWPTCCEQDQRTRAFLRQGGAEMRQRLLYRVEHPDGKP